MRPLGPIALAALFAVACGQAPSDETPSGAVRLFVSAMERSERDPAALREAYALLAEPSRRALQERAHLAGSLGGREFEPWEMIVRGRFRRSFTVAEGSSGMRESIDGNEASVTVEAEDGTRSARVPLMLEDGRWRVLLELAPPRE